jgi:hypothetical protein
VKKHIDQYSKEIIEQGYSPELPSAWEDALAMLEQQPATPWYKKKRAAWLFLLPILCIIGGALFMFNPKVSNHLITQEELVVPTVSTKESVQQNQNQNQNQNLIAQFDIQNESIQQKSTADSKLDIQLNSIDNGKLRIENACPTLPSAKRRELTVNNGQFVKTEAKTEINHFSNTSVLLSKRQEEINLIENQELVIEDGELAMDNRRLFKNEELVIDEKLVPSRFQLVSVNDSSLQLEKLSHLNAPVKPTLSSTKWKKSISFLGGMNATSSQMTITNQLLKIYAQRKNNEENYTLSKSANIEFGLEKNSWQMRLGIGYSEISKNANYHNSFLNPVVTPYLVPEIRYLYNSTTGQIEGSFTVLVTKLDTQYLQTSIDQNLTRQSQQLSYLEVPLSVGYSFGKKRLRFSPSVGLSLGMLIGKEGKTIDRNQFGVVALSSENIFSKFMVRTTLGMDLEYKMTNSSSMILRGNAGLTLNNLYNGASKLKENPLNYGIQIGWKKYL